MIARDGYRVFDYDPAVAEWADAALKVARTVAGDPKLQGPDTLRHGQTWFVGVDALPNAADGAIAGVPLSGLWQRHVPKLPLHRAQVSIIYEGYPKQDTIESDGNHRYRRIRAAAHVDGLLPQGPNRRRYAQEFHAYVLSLPLNNVAASPTVVWRGSHHIMQAALREAFAGRPPAEVDITDAYQAARRTVFERCEKVQLSIKPGQCAIMHRFVLHGTESWDVSVKDPKHEGRMIAFFRPECAGGAEEWINGVD